MPLPSSSLLPSGSLYPESATPQTISPASIGSEEAFGSLVIGFLIAPPAVASDEDFGTATITAGAVTISPASITSEESVGAPSLAEWASAAGGLEFHITGLFYPGETTVPYYGRIADPVAGEVTIPLNNSRRASVTVSVYDPIIDALKDPDTDRLLTYGRFLKVYYRKRLIFWGPWKLADADLDGGTITLSAMDPSLRLIRHQLRRGDLDNGLTADNDDQAYVTVDHFGMRILRDAGLNTDGQTARGVPDLGIIDGSNDVMNNPSVVIGVRRWDQVWATMIRLSEEDDGPDFEIEPIEDTEGAYAKLNTYVRQGDDVSERVVFHYGTGKQNLNNLRFVDGAKYTTHVHVVSRDGMLRRTVANLDSSAETGPYVDADIVDWDAFPAFQGADVSPWQLALDALDSAGQGIIKAWGRPLLEVSLDLPVEADDSFAYGRDYKPGDTVGVAGRAGLVNLEPGAYRITSVTLRQTVDNGVQPELAVVAERTAELGDGVTGTEE